MTTTMISLLLVVATTSLLVLTQYGCDGFSSSASSTSLQFLYPHHLSTATSTATAVLLPLVGRTHPPSPRQSPVSSELPMIFGRGKPKNDDDATAVEKGKTKQDTYLPGKKISVNTRSKWGMNDEDEEYDLEMALDNSTDPFITKVVAGSLIVSIFTLLIVAIIIPATTDYGEGVCQPLLNGGRC